MREGRTFTTRRVEATQFDKPVLDLTCSFAADVDAGVYVYDLPGASAVAGPDGFEPESGPGPWVAGFVGPSEPRADGTRESTHRMWFRIPASLPDDEHLHTALLGFATDWTGIGGRPLHLDGDIAGHGQPRPRGLVPSAGTRRRVAVLRRALARERGRTRARCGA